MGERATEWLAYAEEDFEAASELLGSHDMIALYHAHQAAEKGLKALQIHRENDYSSTHDLVRLFNQLNIPVKFRQSSKTSTRRIPRRDTRTRTISKSEIQVQRWTT